jgi:hypothetical protein
VGIVGSEEKDNTGLNCQGAPTAAASYRVPAKGYGAAKMKGDFQEPVNVKALSEAQQTKLRGWIGQMTLDNTLGVLGGFLVVSSFLILGAQLLQPKELVPEEQKVAGVLATMLGNVWGRFGYWFMVVGVLVGFFGTTLTNQDGGARLLAKGTDIMLRPLGAKGSWQDQQFLKKLYLVVLVGIIPVAIYAVNSKPVGLRH